MRIMLLLWIWSFPGQQKVLVSAHEKGGGDSPINPLVVMLLLLLILPKPVEVVWYSFYNCFCFGRCREKIWLVASLWGSKCISIIVTVVDPLYLGESFSFPCIVSFYLPAQTIYKCSQHRLCTNALRTVLDRPITWLWNQPVICNLKIYC